MNYINLLLHLYQFKRNAMMTRKNMVALQQRKLRKILKYTYHHSEYTTNHLQKQALHQKI